MCASTQIGSLSASWYAWLIMSHRNLEDMDNLLKGPPSEWSVPTIFPFWTHLKFNFLEEYDWSDLDHGFIFWQTGAGQVIWWHHQTVWNGGKFLKGKSRHCYQKRGEGGFPGGAVVESLPANAQGTRVRALVWEDPTCRGAAGPVNHNYWACASGACAPQREAAIVRGPRTAMKSGPHSPQLEKALAQKRRPNTAKNKHNK